MVRCNLTNSLDRLRGQSGKEGDKGNKGGSSESGCVCVHLRPKVSKNLRLESKTLFQVGLTTWQEVGGPGGTVTSFH